MKVLIIGNGGREHAIAWKLKQSKHVTKIFATPFNPGIASIGECLSFQVEAIKEILHFALNEGIDLTVVGPEVPLSLGIVDAFRNKGLKIFGPTQAAARIESSKQFAKNLMAKYNVPTAAFRSFSKREGLKEYIDSFKLPPVIKADGLAAGKGVIIPSTHDEAFNAAIEILEKGQFGSAGASIVVEEQMNGPEASMFALTDGKSFKLFASAEDHKRVFDGDKGPNTGGMGAYAPSAKVTEPIKNMVCEKIIAPVIAGMAKEGCPYTGVLYAGLMLTVDGPRVIEFNCRFGDPETEVIMPLFEGDLYEAFMASVSGTVDSFELKNSSGSAATVVLASGGYPDSYEKGKVISGIEAAEKCGATVFHAGTKSENGKIVTTGGRVLNVVGRADTLQKAIDTAYKGVKEISFEKMQYRTDIGKKGLL
ncbi:MAG: phosphoribosylamine--glycine ligase [Fibrobacteres bacterium]|nr:phosphoribosylamine--glycine ligase [Fibrobacterota bacterium]